MAKEDKNTDTYSNGMQIPVDTSTVTTAHPPASNSTAAAETTSMTGDTKEHHHRPRGRTTGEKTYNILQFIIGIPVIVAATAIIAYIAKDGAAKYDRFNFLKVIQKFLDENITKRKPFGINTKWNEVYAVIAGGLASSVLLIHGGNLFAPILKWMEDSKEKFVTFVNKRWGKPGEVEKGHDRLKDEPKQKWSDILKGRLGSWGIVFSAFTGADLLAGKNKKLDVRRFDQYVNWIGKLTANLTKSGKQLAQSITPEMDYKQIQGLYANNKMYKFGKIIALDIFATAAALLTWNIISRSSAQKRHRREQQAEHKQAPAAVSSEVSPVIAGTGEKETEQEKKPSSFAVRENSNKGDFQTRVGHHHHPDAEAALNLLP